jgi:hypothetical protein
MFLAFMDEVVRYALERELSVIGILVFLLDHLEKAELFHY